MRAERSVGAVHAARAYTSANRRRIYVAAAALVLAGAALLVSADSPAQEDLTRPPRIDVDEAQATSAEPDTPRDAQVAVEEIVVISDQNPWRLPDLGSSWRTDEESPSDAARIDADLLPLWNPDESEMPTRNPFAVGDDFRRVGFIEVFRVRFGNR